jgi:hypothetical protein
MGWFNKFEDGSRTVLLMARESAGMKKKFVLVSAIVVVGAVAGVLLLTRHMSSRAEERLATSWGSLARCLLGEPVKQGERPSVRFRALQLTSMTQAETTRAPAGGEPWPNRCARHAHDLREALVEASKAQKDTKDLAYWSEKLATALRDDGSFRADLSEVVDATWEQGARSGIAPVFPPDLPAAPAAASAMSCDSLVAAGPLSASPIDLRALEAEVHPSTAIKFLVEQKDVAHSPFVCTFTGAPAGARCAEVSSDVAATQHGFRLLGSSDEEADPLVFAGNRGSEGVFRAGTGEKVDAVTTHGGWAAKDGMSALLAWDDAARQLKLVRKPAGKAKAQVPVAPEAKVKIGSAAYDAQMLWNQVLFRGVNRFGELWLVAAEMGAGDATLGAFADVGQLAEGGAAERTPAPVPQLSGCRAAKALVVRARGERNELLSFLVAGKWTKPVQAPGVGGALGCRKAEASITRVDPSRTESLLETSITHHRCTPASCQTTTIKMDDFLKGEAILAPKGGVVAADLDGKLLVVWGAAERGGVRMRLAPPDKVARAEDVVLFDDLLKDGQVQKTSQLFDMRLLGRERFALLLLSTSTGTHALRVEPDGKVAPVKPEWD